MTPEELARAVERLRGQVSAVWMIPDEGPDTGSRNITRPLAALIEAAARPLRYRHADHILEICHICRQRAHAADCALVALVRAINGEGER